jgi:hypothetical protein
MNRKVVIQYLKASTEDSYLFIKVDENLAGLLFDILYDEGYTVASSNEDIYNKMSCVGRSYVVTGKSDIDTFKKNRLALLQKTYINGTK